MSAGAMAIQQSFGSPRFDGGDVKKKDWNDFQHIAAHTDYGLSSPRYFAGYNAQRRKLAGVKKQIFNPRLPTIRRMERDDTLCRLPDEHSRHTTFIDEEEFEKMDPTQREPYIDFTGLNWHDCGKVLMGTYHEGWPQRSNTPTFGARLRADKSERHSQSSESVHRSYLNHPVQYNYRNYGHGTLDKNSKYNLWPRFHMNTRNSFDSINRMPLPKNMENIFRSSSMKASVSSSPWKPSGAVTARDV